MNCVHCPLKNSETCPGGSNPALCYNEEFLNKMRKAAQLPSPWQQAMNFAGAVVEHVMDGMEKTTPEEQQHRLSICRTCDRFREIDQRCAECGCFIPEAITWRSKDCPLKKWIVAEQVSTQISEQSKLSQTGGCGCGGVIS